MTLGDKIESLPSDNSVITDTEKSILVNLYPVNEVVQQQPVQVVQQVQPVVQQPVQVVQPVDQQQPVKLEELEEPPSKPSVIPYTRIGAIAFMYLLLTIPLIDTYLSKYTVSYTLYVKIALFLVSLVVAELYL